MSPEKKVRLPKLSTRRTRGIPYATARFVNADGTVDRRSYGRADCPAELARANIEFQRDLALWLDHGCTFPAEQETADLPMSAIIEKYRAKVRAEKGEDWLSSRGNGSRVFYALKDLEAFCGPTSGADFNALRFETFREQLLNSGRMGVAEVNGRGTVIQRMARWAGRHQLMPSENANAIALVENYDNRGTRAEKAKRDRRRVVEEGELEAVLPLVSPTIADWLLLLRATGARPKEWRDAKVGEVDRSKKDDWQLVLRAHKTAHKTDEPRIVPIPSSVQAIVARRIVGRPDDAPILPNPATGGCMGTGTLRNAVFRAMDKLGLPKEGRWVPYSLRDTRITEIIREHGWEVAATVAGHASTETTRRHYSHIGAEERARTATAKMAKKKASAS